MVVCDVDHVICIYCAEGRKPVTDNGEEGDEDTVDDVDDVNLATADIDPADEEENPCETEKGDQCGI